MKLAGEVALVTGAGQGIGKAVALRLAAEGADVAVLDVNRETADIAAREVEGLGRRSVACSLDVADVTAIRTVVGDLESSFGPLTVLVNAAGIITTQPFLDVSESDWDRTFAVNVKGVFFCLQAVARYMAARRRGQIVSIASVAGRSGRSAQTAYAASKAAVINITRSAAKALGNVGVRVNCVCPGTIDTPMWTRVVEERAKLGGREDPRRITEAIPLGRIGRPDEVAALIAFLVSDDARYITGQSYNVCGGLELS